MKEYFNEIRAKGRDGGRVCTKFLIVYDIELKNLIEIIKEDIVEYRLFIKRQEVAHHSIETTGWFIKLHPEIDLQSM